MMELPTNETLIFKINQVFARSKNAPVYFAAKVVLQTPKAAYLYGHGTLETRRFGVCCVCGRTLTNPVSMALGVGPECGGHFHNWDLIGGYSKENAEAITKAVQENMPVDGWFPKSIIKETMESEAQIQIPADHPMLKKPEKKEQVKKATQVTYQDNNRPAIKIEFPFDPDTLNKVKLIPGRRFHNEGYNAKYWTAPLSVDAVEQLQDLGFQMDQALIEYLEKSKIHVDDMPEIDIPGLGMELFPYQKKGVAFIEAKDGRALVGDEMGLGKTAQSLAWLQLHPEKRPVVIVVPASLKLNWSRECGMWMSNPKVQVLSGKKANTPIVGEIIIINYDIIGAWVKALKAIKPQVLITDECHKWKNNKAQRTKAIKALGKVCPHVIALSGTPIENRPAEIYNAVKMIDPGVAGPWTTFGKRYCNGHHNGFGWDFNGASNVAELHEKLTNTCFPYKTIIYLESGPQYIGDIVNNKNNNRILCYDTKTASLQWRQIQAHGKFPAPNRTVRIKHKFGELNCTPDHRIWTKEKGYVRAEEITSDLSLLVLQTNQNSSNDKFKDKCKILLRKMCGKTSGRNWGIKMENEGNAMGRPKNKISTKNMQTLWKNHPFFTKILFHKLLNKIQCGKSVKSPEERMGNNGEETKRNEKNTFRKSVGKFKSSWREEKRNRIIPTSMQKYVKSTKKEMVQNKNRRSSSKSMENIRTGEKSACGTWMARRLSGIHTTIAESYRPIQKRRTLFSLFRYSPSCIKTGHRNRWSHPLTKKTESDGSLERKRTKTVRVDSIEIYECTSRRRNDENNEENYVYDLQIEKENNYFANGCLVHNCMIRRKKADVLKDLPAKVRSFVPMEIDNLKKYKVVEADFIGWVKREKGLAAAEKAGNAEALAKISALKQLAAEGKMKQAIDWIKDHLDTNGKLVVFAVHKKTIDRLMNELSDYSPVKVDGSVSQDNRQVAVDTFQNDPRCRVFVGNINAAGVGLTLTAASSVAFVEIAWSPGEHDQAEDRIHRIGQTADSVNAYYLLAGGTIEETMAKLIDSKRKVLDQVLDGIETDSKNLLGELMEQYSKA